MGAGILAALAINVACAVVCFMKGKPWFGLLGVFVAGPFGWIGAARIAKPGSSWYLKYQHQPWKEEMAKVRFPKEAKVASRRRRTSSWSPPATP